MRKVFRMFRILTAIAGMVCLFGAAGTDEMYTNMRQMPPESIENLLVIGLILLIPTAWHILREKE